MSFNLNVPKRTHQITVKSLKGSEGTSKSFSIYTKKYGNTFLFNEINKVMNNENKLNRPMYFDVEDCSHVIILLDMRTLKCYSKCFPLHQYSVSELYQFLKKHFIKGVTK